MAETGSTTTAHAKGKKRATAAEVAASSKRVRTLDRAPQSYHERDDGTDDEDEEWEVLPPELCPITDKDIRPFRLMDLPAEIRVEIYRACLTRPFDILLSRVPVSAGRGTVLEDPSEEDGVDVDMLFVPPSSPRTVVSPSQNGLAAAVGNATAANGSHSGLARRLSRQITSLDGGEVSNLRPFRSTRLTNRPAMPNATASAIAGAAVTRTQAPTPIVRSSTAGRATSRPAPSPESSRVSRLQDGDPLLVNLLRASKLIYKEARNIMYGENAFSLDLETAQPTLSALHQRSRGQIRNLRLTIPTHNEILERFAEVVRLSLRYCWKLKILHINMPFVLPGTDGSGTSGNTTVYANAFDILRWLPRKCAVVLEGNVCEEIRAVVDKNANLARSLDELQYARRQLISNESATLPISEPES